MNRPVGQAVIVIVRPSHAKGSGDGRCSSAGIDDDIGGNDVAARVIG